MNDQLHLQFPASVENEIVRRDSSRARHLSINANPLRGIEVVVPRGTSEMRIARFVQQHHDWIRQQQAKFADRLVSSGRDLPASICFPSLEHRTFRVVYQTASSAQVRVTNDQLTLVANARIDQDCAYRKLLNRSLIKLAKECLVPRLESMSDSLGLRYRQVQVRGQKSLWGSYSTSGTLSINFCLLFLPADLVDYVFIHELCHIVHHNHSKRFWKLVASFQRNYQQCEKRLDAAWRYLPGWLEL